jgi:hypothetical protein
MYVEILLLNVGFFFCSGETVVPLIPDDFEDYYNIADTDKGTLYYNQITLKIIIT